MSSDIISEDGQLLVSKFLEKNSIQYSDFLEVWKELSFTQLLCIPSLLGARSPSRSDVMFIELTHRLLQVGAGHMCKEGSEERVKLAGLFMCYSVYFVQPLEVKVRIRVTVDGWAQLNMFYSHLKEKKLHQAWYMLITLRDNAAFSVSYTPSQMSLLFSNKDDPKTHFQFCLPESNAGLVDVRADISTLSSVYDQMKEGLAMFLPTHLLEPSGLPQKLEGVIKDYPKCKNSQQ